MVKELSPIACFVKEKRKLLKLTQQEFADRIGVGYNFIRQLEQGKKSVRLDKVNEVLYYLGYEAAPRKRLAAVKNEQPS
jgi:y4mF family transcriptional regulator